MDPPESFYRAAVRECLEEAGIDALLKGVLRVEYSVGQGSHARMKVVFYAEPRDENQLPKSYSDGESEEAQWHTIQDLLNLRNQEPGWRGSELYDWAMYIENGGIIYPLSSLAVEGREVKLVTLKDVVAFKPIENKNKTEIDIHDKALKEFRTLLIDNNEEWFFNDSNKVLIDKIRDSNGNNPFQMACIEKNIVFAKNCLMLMNVSTSFIGKNDKSQNIMHTVLNTIPNDMANLTIMKIVTSLDSSQLYNIFQSKDIDGISPIDLINKLNKDTNFRAKLEKIPMIHKFLQQNV